MRSKWQRTGSCHIFNSFAGKHQRKIGGATRLLVTLIAELRRYLAEPRIGCTQDMPKGRAADVSVDESVGIKLGVVEGVEHLQPQFKRATLFELRFLVKRHIEVLDSRPIKHAPLRVPLRAQRIRCERSDVEVWQAVTRVVVDYFSRAWTRFD